MGALLGILPSGSSSVSPIDLKPVIKAVALPGSVVLVSFVRGNTDGATVETKLDNGTWSDAGRYFKSPAQLPIPQNSDNLPRAVQVRARYVERRHTGRPTLIGRQHRHPAGRLTDQTRANVSDIPACRFFLFKPASLAKAVLFSFSKRVFSRSGQTLDEKLLLIGKLVPSFHPRLETIGANIAFSKTLHGVFAFKQYNLVF